MFNRALVILITLIIGMFLGAIAQKHYDEYNSFEHQAERVLYKVTSSF